MKYPMKIMIAAAVGAAAAASGTAFALTMQADAAAQLRATGQVGEQADGYLGLVGTANSDIRSQMDAVNIQRRAYYTQLASRRSATIEEVAAATACEIFASRIGAGQHYRLPDGVWRSRNGSEPVPRPAHCG